MNTNAVVMAAVEVARRWPSPAMRLRGGKVAVPVSELGDVAGLVTEAIYVCGKRCVQVVA